MKNFIDLVVDLSKDSNLADEFHKFFEESDHVAISNFLKEKGYAVTEEECKKIIENKDDLKSSKLGYFY